MTAARRSAAQLRQWAEGFDLSPRRAAAFLARLRRRIDAELRRRGAGDVELLAWCRRYLPHHFVRPASAMHRWLAACWPQLRGPMGAKVNCLAPRGSAKSTLGAMAVPLRAALEGRHPYIWLVSDTKPQAHAHLENIRSELETNARIARDYPEALASGLRCRAGRLVLGNGATIEAFGAGQRLRGRRRRQWRPTLIVCDDLQNEDHILSARRRQRALDWFDGTLLPAGAARFNVLNLATALHPEAIAMLLLRRPVWRSAVFASIARWPDDMSAWAQWESIYLDVQRPDAVAEARRFFDEHRSAMLAGAEVLWPEVEDLYTLMCLRAEQGRSAFAREKQNSPIPPESCEWPESYFDGPIWFDDWPARLRVKTMALDPSKGGDARRGDYSALVMLGLDAEGLIYVDADLARRPTPEIVADGVARHRAFQPDVFGIEANQFQDLLAELFEAEFRRQGLLGPRPQPIENRTAKVVRIRRIGPHLAAKRLRFKRNSPGARLLVEQLRVFPAGDHDDGPDALEMALRLAAAVLSAHAQRADRPHRLRLEL